MPIFFQNNLLIDIVKERHLPQGLEGWRAVAMAFQNVSNEANLCGEGTHLQQLGEEAT
jgi:hypothetical protein